MTELAQVKSLEEHFTYTERLARISFFYARKYLVKKAPGKSLGECIRDHTPLLYHSLFHYEAATKWSSEPCQRILARANEMADLPPEEFEERMWESIRDYSRQRAEENYPMAVGVTAPPSWHCGSLTYDPPQGQPDGWVVFHIANGVGPHSIFEDPEYLPCCFRLLMKETEVKYNSNTLTTSTWLNDRPRWLALFPQEWHDNLSPKDPNALPAWSVASWGQIITSRGTVDPKREQAVRDTGILKYATRKSHCSFENLRRRLDDYLREIR